jgi:hypothetical protein
MTATPADICASCGASVTGSFCGRCGAKVGPRSCARCQAILTDRARFCHRCGTRAAGGSGQADERTPWIFAFAGSFVVIVFLVLFVVRGHSAPAVPDMANTGSPVARGGPAAQPSGGGTPPDISRMSPEERFNRLYDRVIGAAEQGDTATALRFSPMALMAYQQLDQVTTDARYHAAMVHLTRGEVKEAAALADTILTTSPGHLFGFMIRGEVAKAQHQTAPLRQAEIEFLKHYQGELKTGRPEYDEHRIIVDNFRQQAETDSKR